MGAWAALIEMVSSRLAFFPPQPRTYSIAEDRRSSATVSQSTSVSSPSARLVMTGNGGMLSEKAFAGMRHCDVLRLRTERRSGGGGGTTIAAVFVPYPNAKTTILYSHGNAVDLGVMQTVYRALSDIMGVNVLGYDYSGYGESTGKPTVRNTLADIRACYRYLTEDQMISPSDVILYGQSVGSGPTCELASKIPSIGGCVLHSPLASGIRVFNPELKKWPTWLDIYPNFKLVPKINCPVLILHGTEDEVIDISHGKWLHSLCTRPATPMWAEGFNHQNLDLCPEYIPTLQHYIGTLKYFSSQ